MKNNLLTWFSCISLALSCSAFGEMGLIQAEVNFTEAVHLLWWTGVSLPAHGYITCWYDTGVAEEEEWENDDTFASYETPAEMGGMISIYLESPAWYYYIELPGSEVEVWNRRNDTTGISFGNLNAYWHNGYSMWFPDYYGIYASFRVPSSWGGVTMDGDKLSNVWRLQGNETLRYISYAYMDAWLAYQDPDNETSFRDNVLSYSVDLQ